MNQLLERLLKGELDVVMQFKGTIIEHAMIYINHTTQLTEEDLDEIYCILYMSNILYNNTTLNMLILEDGVYDILLEKYKTYRNNAPVGAVPIYFNEQQMNYIVDEPMLEDPFKFFNDRDLMYNELKRPTNYCSIPPLESFAHFTDSSITKRTKNVSHEYPELVGTLDKCKFVMNYQAEEKGVLNDSNVTVLERDFFADHIKRGILDPNRVFSMCLELKYDGISVEHDVTTTTFRSRGDAINGVGADLTPILKNYPFFNKPATLDPFGIKYEAIMTYHDLARYNRDKGYEYKNCRTAISGLFSSSNAYQYVDYITLVPLQSSLNIDRHTEIEFLNKYFTKGIPLMYSIVSGTYQEVLFQIKRYVEEAEMMRDFIPFMYDGIVVSYMDQDLITTLGRENAVNKYSVAVKFNALKKSTIFKGYTYSVGQDGSITPMIHYEPVEFYGTIHDKSTGHSYDRFKTLLLKVGDVVDVEYVNDVMPYVSKPWNSANDNNRNPYVQFITECPSCGTTLVESKSGKTILCTNKLCQGRSIARMVNMMQKLDLKDFGEANLLAIGLYSFHELMSLRKQDVTVLGDVMSDKLMSRINEIKTKPLYDYQLVGALGFTNMGRRNWKLIFDRITPQELLDIYVTDIFKLRTILTDIRGIGSVRADTIIDELQYFMADIQYMILNTNMIQSFGSGASGKKIRLTGFRNKELIQQLEILGHDIGEGSVTKDTDILLVPSHEHKSSKIDKAHKYGVKVVPVQLFLDSMEYYLQ